MGLRVALVIEATNGGVARHVLDLAYGLIGNGHSVHVVFSQRRIEPRFVDGLSQKPAIRTAAIDMRREPHPSDALASIAIRRYLRQHGPFDVVHGHSSKAGALARIAACGLSTARVYTPHCLRTLDPALGWTGRTVYGGAELVLSRFCEAIIAVSPDELEHAVQLGIPRRKLHVVINGVDQAQRSNRAGLRAQLGLRDGEVCVGFLARYVPQKAPERLLEVVSELDPDLPSFRIAMVGDGPLESSLRTRAAALGIADRIIFAPGSIGPTAMSAFDIFTLPSAYEAMPYVLLEAAANGLPIVATAVSGSASVIVPEKNGFIVSNWDRRDFARQLSRIIRDRDLRLRMGRESLQTGRMFTVERMIQETVDVYAAAMEHRVQREVSYKDVGIESGVKPGRSERFS